MLVEVPVSSIKTSREGSSIGWAARQAARAAATSGRSCSLACTIFFEADPLGGKETPHRPVADMDAASGKRRPDLLQGQIGRRRDQRQQPLAFLSQTRAAIASHRPGDKPAFALPGVNPFDHRAHRNGKQTSRALSRQTALNRANNPLPQVR